MALCGVSCLKSFCVLLAGLLFLVSCAGIAFSLYMLFGEPFAQRSGNTYRPNWENIGPCLFASLISLVMNLLLGGAAVQGSRKLLTAWLAWHLTLVLLYWAWFSYSLLKHHGYIDWRTVGMRECYWCTLDIIETVGLCFISTLILISTCIMYTSVIFDIIETEGQYLQYLSMFNIMIRMLLVNS
jgi:hypothetical protein